MISKYFANICRDSSNLGWFFFVKWVGLFSKKKKSRSYLGAGFNYLGWAFKQTASNWAAGSGLPRDSCAKCLIVFNAN